METTAETTDYILQHCDLDELQQLVTSLEEKYEITLVKEPSICLTMIRAQDSVEAQDFYLGEALTSDCEVSFKNNTGYGFALGDEPVRAYCIAVIDVLQQTGDAQEMIALFLKIHEQVIKKAEKLEYNQIQKTRVDFKMMEQA